MAFFAMLFSQHAAAIEVEGEISTDTVWTRNMSPYIVTGDITVAEDVTLTIEPGTVIEFKKTGSSDGSELIINGTLQALGDENDPILFTIDNKEYYWGHIEFAETSTAWDEENDTGCILRYCIIEYAGNGKVDTPEKAAIRVTSASPLIHSNIIRYSKSDGIRAVSGIQNIIDNRIHDTDTGIKLITPDKGLVQNNYLINNIQGIYVESGADSVEVIENTVTCSSSEGYGSALGINMLFHNNLSSFLWEQIAGPEVALDDATTVTPRFTVPDVGQDEILVFQVTVTDIEGMQAVDTVNINISWENAPPVADAGSNREVEQGDLVTLDGTDSFDPDGGILTYDWIQTSGTDVTAGWTQDSDGKYRSFIAPAPDLGDEENLVFQLTVTDNNGAESLDSVVITVKSPDADNEPPIADAGDVQTGVEGSVITLNGAGSFDPDGTIVSYLWKQTEGGYVDLNNPATPNPDFTAPDVAAEGETFTFELTVTDDNLEKSTATVIVNVIDDDTEEPNHPPVAVATVEPGETVVNEGQTNITLIGSDSYDPDVGDAVSTYLWKQISGPGVVLYGTGSERNFTAPNVKENEQLVFCLTVVDVDGLRSTDTVSVTVNWVNTGPAADAGTDQTVDEGIIVQLDGSGSNDSDDGIFSYNWTQVEGTAVELLNADSQKAIFTAPDVTDDEILVFLLTVTDNSGVTDYDNVHVTVEADNTSPVANAGPDRVVAFGQAGVILDGSASSDPDGTIVSYLWEQIGEETVTLYDATTESPYFTAPAADVFGPSDQFVSLTFKLTVKDDDGQESVDTVMVNVTDDPGATVPVADAGRLQTVNTGAEVILDGSNSYDPELNAQIRILNNSFSYLLIDGLDQDGDENPGNIVGITRGAEANSILVYRENNMENIDGNFSIFLYDWADEDMGLVDLTNNWWGTIIDEQIGDLIYDMEFDSTLPEVVYQPVETLKVENAGSSLSYPPMAKAGEDQTADPDDTVTLNCPDVYDPDQVLSYYWEQTGGIDVVLDNADAAETTFIVPALPDEDEQEDDIEKLKTLKFLLTVTDPYGFFDTDEVVVTINETDAEDDGNDVHSSSGCFISTICR